MDLAYFYISLFAILACVAIPAAIAVLLRKAGFWNGIASLASMAASIAMIGASLSGTGYASILGGIALYWIIPASWTLVFGLFSLALDRNKVLAIVALSVLAFAFVILVAII